MDRSSQDLGAEEERVEARALKRRCWGKIVFLTFSRQTMFLSRQPNYSVKLWYVDLFSACFFTTTKVESAGRGRQFCFLPCPKYVHERTLNS